MRFARLADEELLELTAGVDPAAFRTVLERHEDAAFALAYRICGTRAVAEQVTQESLLLVWRAAARYDSTRGSVRAWTLRIVRNRAIDAMRSHSGRSELRTDDIALPLTGAYTTATHGSVEGERLRTALLDMPDAQRQAIELAYFGGFTQLEIASILGQSLDAVRARMRCGMRELRAACQTGKGRN